MGFCIDYDAVKSSLGKSRSEHLCYKLCISSQWSVNLSSGVESDIACHVSRSKGEDTASSSQSHDEVKLNEESFGRRVIANSDLAQSH